MPDLTPTAARNSPTGTNISFSTPASNSSELSTVSNDSSSTAHRSSMLQIHRQNQFAKKEIKQQDVKDIVKTRVDLVIWPRAKYPDMEEGPIAEAIKNELQTALSMDTEEFNLRWKDMKKQMRNRLRNKRGYTVQIMKDQYFGGSGDCHDVGCSVMRADPNFLYFFFVQSN